MDARLQRRPSLAQMMQLAAQVGERLDIARVGPQGSADSLPWNRGAAGMEHQKRDELLLSCTRRTGRDAPISEDVEPSKQRDAQISHG